MTKPVWAECVDTYSMGENQVGVRGLDEEEDSLEDVGQPKRDRGGLHFCLLNREGTVASGKGELDLSRPPPFLQRRRRQNEGPASYLEADMLISRGGTSSRKSAEAEMEQRACLSHLGMVQKFRAISKLLGAG